MKRGREREGKGSEGIEVCKVSNGKRYEAIGWMKKIRFRDCFLHSLFPFPSPTFSFSIPLSLRILSLHDSSSFFPPVIYEINGWIPSTSFQFLELFMHWTKLVSFSLSLSVSHGIFSPSLFLSFYPNFIQCHFRSEKGPHILDRHELHS